MSNTVKIIQINLNRSWGAYDLLTQYMAEANVGLNAISEPPRSLPENSLRFLSEDGLAAVLWRPESSKSKICRLVTRGEKYVMVCFGDVYIISSYISPNLNSSCFSRFLDDLSITIGTQTRQFLVCGDFNAHAAFWGSPDTDRRGELTVR